MQMPKGALGRRRQGERGQVTGRGLTSVDSLAGGSCVTTVGPNVGGQGDRSPRPSRSGSELLLLLWEVASESCEEMTGLG